MSFVDGTTVLNAANLNPATVYRGTGAQIAALSPTYAGMLAFCTSTGSGFTAGRLYQRNEGDTAWDEVAKANADDLVDFTQDWTKTAKSLNTTYQNGSKAALLTVRWRHDDAYLYGGQKITYVYSDSNATPTTVVGRADAGTDYGAAAIGTWFWAGTITVLIQPNDYYRVTSTMDAVDEISIYEPQ